MSKPAKPVTDSDAFISRARALEKKGEIEIALNFCEEAYRRNPGKKGILKQLERLRAKAAKTEMVLHVPPRPQTSNDGLLKYYAIGPVSISYSCPARHREKVETAIRRSITSQIGINRDVFSAALEQEGLDQETIYGFLTGIRLIDDTYFSDRPDSY